jgi:hypothetical protein
MNTLVLAAAAAAAIGLASPGAALADWTRTYAIEWIETATYFGGGENAGIIDPGTDCPNGANPEPDWVEMLVNSGQYTHEEAEWIRDPANPERSAAAGNPKMGLRGKDRANVYRQPWTYADPGLVPMEGDIAEGINLDGDVSTGFVRPDGERGVDNNFYKALGCWKTFRGPPRMSSGAGLVNESMRNGAWTMVIVAEGDGDDPMNDENVRVGIYQSGDPLMKTGDGQDIASDYTFSIAPHERYEGVFDARVVNGRITTKAPTRMVMRDPSSGAVRSGLELEQAQIDFTMAQDGSLKGFLGGYREWAPVYLGWGGFGQVNEVLTWIDLPAAWYAMQREADYSPEGPDGAKTHISFALRVEAVPAFVMSPDASQIAEVRSYKQAASEDAGGRVAAAE